MPAESRATCRTPCPRRFRSIVVPVPAHPRTVIVSRGAGRSRALGRPDPLSRTRGPFDGASGADPVPGGPPEQHLLACILPQYVQSSGVLWSRETRVPTASSTFARPTARCSAGSRQPNDRPDTLRVTFAVARRACGSAELRRNATALDESRGRGAGRGPAVGTTRWQCRARVSPDRCSSARRKIVAPRLRSQVAQVRAPRVVVSARGSGIPARPGVGDGRREPRAGGPDLRLG